MDQLLSEIDEYEFYSEPMEGKISLNKFNDYFKINKINFHDKNSLNKLVEELEENDDVQDVYTNAE